ncbi:MAG: glycoside hydrolase domain-containing protein [Actinomycetota bacterium]
MMGTLRRTVLTVAVLTLGMVLVPGLATAAPPEVSPVPAGAVDYSADSSATRAYELGFDTCSAPSIGALRAWRGESPYSVANIYFGGVNRACEQPNLSAAWVHEATALGWRLLPTYVGHQPFCMPARDPEKFTASNAAELGASDAEDAVARADELGLLQGSALYANIEDYDRTPACGEAVRRYVSAWTTTLHDAGYLAGVYVHFDSGLRDLSAGHDSTTYARPDAVWMADWDRKRSLRSWPTAPDRYWAVWQRAKQYRGDHDETWDDVTINIDSNIVRAPLGTVARAYTVTSSASLEARTGPSTSYPVVRDHAPGSGVAVVCQTRGQKVGATPVWNRLASGEWVPDHFVSTPPGTGFTAELPRCTYPGQVMASGALNARTGPGMSYPTAGSPLPRGALAWVVCQQVGGKVGTTLIWNQLRDGRWVSDFYVSNGSNTTLSPPIPLCP